jgi:hypothetical protein
MMPESSNPGYVHPATEDQKTVPFRQPLPEVKLPGIGRPKSDFTKEVGKILGPLNVLFRKDERPVEIFFETFNDELDRFKMGRGGFKFREMEPARLTTWIEDHLQIGINVSDKAQNGKNRPSTQFSPLSMSENISKTLLASPQLLKELPRISRILDVALPIRKANNEVVMPQPGYNRELKVYLAPNAPKVQEIPLEKALTIIASAYVGFGFKNEQSRVHAIARLLTPYARGIMGFAKRVPLWFYLGNRPRAGKDYCNGIAQIVYLGRPFEDASLGNNPEETRKRITAALLSGRRQVHFANCQGYIDDRNFIQAITAPVWNDRRLGSNGAESDLSIPNEIEYSISANVGVTYRDDIEPRSRKIDLAYYDENDNQRVFPKPLLHDWVAQNRELILSAIHSCFVYWGKKGGPPGPTLFNSFPEWASVVGGVMHVCGLGDPCLPHKEQDIVGGDQKTIAMKAVYELAFETLPNRWIKKSVLYDLVSQSDDDRLAFFGDFTEDERKNACKKLGKNISAFQQRVLSGICMELDTSYKKTQQQSVRFSKTAQAK